MWFTSAFAQLVRPYTRAQVAHFLAVLGQQRQYRVLVQLLATTGLRISEAIALRWRDIELDGSTPHVSVRRAWVREQLGPPKSMHGRRNVPIGRRLVDELRDHRAHSDPRHELVFTSQLGTVLRPENLRRALMPFAEEADVAWLEFHAFGTGSRRR